MNSTLRRGAAVGALGAFAVLASAPSALAESEVSEPSSFTSAFTVMATPDTIINNDGQAVAGLEGATGTFDFRINSDDEIICYDIELRGVSSDYESPAKTATHIHEAPAGEAGPPRIAFPNPSGSGDTRTSEGCLQGPFTTGLAPEGTDTGDGFSLEQIEADPSGFFADTHTVDNPAGAVRGQLVAMPVGGVDTGGGGTATDDGSALMAVGGGAALLAAGGALAFRYQRSRTN